MCSMRVARPVGASPRRAIDFPARGVAAEGVWHLLDSRTGLDGRDDADRDSRQCQTPIR
jgi:hypothetical protein